MVDGWIKSHRSKLTNEFLQNDNNAYIVFDKLLHLVDKQTGSYTTGRFIFGQIVNLKPMTAYKTLQRLEKNNLITQSGNTKKFTKITVVNWHKYQSHGNKPGNNTVTLNKNKNIYNYKNNYKSKLPEQVQEVYDHFIETFNKNPNQYKLTTKRKNKIGSRLRDAGGETILQAITNTHKSPFHTGDNDRGWQADLDWILRSYEQVERLANMRPNNRHETKRLPLPETKKLSPEEKEKALQKLEEIKQQFRK